MNLVYKKDTLYVYLDEDLNGDVVNSLEQRVNSIMSSYDIDNLVIDSKDKNITKLVDFEKRYNQKHKSKMIIKWFIYDIIT